jgi:hypothetical protein
MRQDFEIVITIAFKTYYSRCTFCTPYAQTRTPSLGMTLPDSNTMTGVTKCKLLFICAISRDHLSQFVFLRELAGQGLQIGNEGFASGNQSLLGCDLSVGLDAHLEGSEEGVRDCATTS